MLHWETVVSLREHEHRSVTKDFNKADFDGIRQALRQVNWDDRLTGDAEQCWGVFKAILHEAVERFVPDQNVKYGTYRKATWMTYKAVKCVRRKHNLFRRYRDVNNPEYAEAVRMARVEVRRSKKNVKMKLAENIKQDNKSFYA
jgi:cell division protein FtsI/penicillin-binding protein 2